MKKPTKKAAPLKLRKASETDSESTTGMSDDHTLVEKMELPNLTAPENGSSYVTSDEAYQKTFDTYDAVYGSSPGETKWAGAGSELPSGKSVAQDGQIGGQNANRQQAGQSGNEEFAAELSPSARQPMGHPNASGVSARNAGKSKENGKAQANLAGQTIGWIALILAISSLFIWPAFLGTAAIVAGIYAWVKGRKTLGGWSVGIGLLSVVSSLVLAPLF